jgi:hypothetical protein
MQCQDCHEYVMELFPATRYNYVEREKENVLLCIGCVPKCEYSGPVGTSIRRCCEPVDPRSEYFCTAHEIAVCEWGLERASGDPEAIAEYRRTIAKLEGEAELARAA